MPTPPAARRGRRILGGLILAALLAGQAVPATAAEPVPGSAGTDTSLPATDSEVTVRGRGSFSDLEITVNQTKKLVNQAISITWTGGEPTTGAFQGHFLQIMQCWGDDDRTTPDNPGPPPEQCVFGAAAIPGVTSLKGEVFSTQTEALERRISQPGWETFDRSEGFYEERNQYLWKPFRAVNGTVINAHYNPTYIAGKSDLWLNTFFNHITTNEIPGARTGANGNGAELFEATTGSESSGLGCGQAVEPVAGGAPRVPGCWLVIVPRGDPAEENVGTGPNSVQQFVMPSPLARRAWQNRIAIPLEFNPVDSPCSLADDQRRLAGTELVVPAVVSWQPSLCTTPGLPPYSYGTVSDAGARQQLLAGVPGAPGMIVVSRPFDRSTLDPENPVVYAPISISALVIGFNLERVPRATPRPPPEEEALKGVRVAEINLTPRLAAKLLTQSYLSQVSIAGQPSTHAWVKGNPRDMGIDPDFLQFNPEFEFLGNNGKNLGGPVMSVLNSDAARQVWEWVLADPEARAWLDGAADQWGMRVNPAYATTAEANSAGAAFADPVPSNFPKSDPYCYQGKPYRSTATGGSIVPPPLCGADWFPYAQGLREAARATRIAFDGARANQNADAIDANTAWKRGGPQTQGSKTFLSLTDSASAFQYGIQMARLSRAGDNGADRAFITPDSAGLIAGVGAMAPKDEPTVLEVDPMAAAPAAYPLTALTYAAIAPLSLDAQARAEYAGFVDYAAGPGQVPGLELGQLPRGFAPLPESLRMQATAAAKSIRELVAAPDPAGGGPSPTAANADAGSAAGGSTAASGSPRSASGSTAAGSGPAPTSPASSLPLVTATGPLSADTPLTRALTPVVALARSRFVLPALVAVLLLSALGALEITKRPRREPGRRQQSTGYLLTTKPVRRVRKETSVDG